MKKENNQGLVLETKINDYRLFFPFDWEKAGEKELLATQELKSIDILQVAHHGFLSSSHLSFLKEIKSKYCLVSSKKISSKVEKKYRNKNMKLELLVNTVISSLKSE